MSTNFNFFKAALKNYKTSGTVVPSSRFLANRMLAQVDFEAAKVIVELGPGNGAITKTILEKITPSTTLVCFEINAEFLKELEKIQHKQLILKNASAEDMIAELSALGIHDVCYIISSLPLTILPKKTTHSILQKCYSLLQSKGKFIQYQYNLTYYKLLKRVFGNNITLSFETLNFPPAFVYQCEK